MYDKELVREILMQIKAASERVLRRERLEGLVDLKMLQRIRKESVSFKKLDAFLEEYRPGV